MAAGRVEAQPAGLTDPDAIQLATGLDTLHVALGHARLYGASHKETAKALSKCYADLSAVLSRTGEIVLHSSPEGLQWAGQPVHPEDDSREGIGRLLFREGIASLSLAPGLAERELPRLLDVLRINLGLPRYEEDTLASLLWQAGFENIGYQALSALDEAEAASGRAVRGGSVDDTMDLVRNVLEVRVAPPQQARRNLRETVEEDVVRRAVDRSRLSSLGPGGGAGAAEDLPAIQSEQQRWKVRFAGEGTEDEFEIESMRGALERERPGDLLARVVLLLLRVAGANRAELPPAEAVELARRGIDDAFERGDTTALARLCEDLPHVARDPELLASPGFPVVLDFVGRAIPATRVARLLLTLGPDQGDPEAVGPLVAALPDETLLMVLDGVSNLGRRGGEVDPIRAGWLSETISAAARPRFERWLESAEVQPAERLILLADAMRGTRSEQVRSARRRLLSSTSRPVREAALRWFLDELPREDAGPVLALLFDRTPSIRQGALEVVGRHRPYEATAFLRDRMGGTDFSTLDAAGRRDLCALFARVAGDTAIDVLVRLLERPATPGREREQAVDCEAAALALSGSGNLAARQHLKRLAGAGQPAARAACAAAIRRAEEAGR